MDFLRGEGSMSMTETTPNYREGTNELVRVLRPFRVNGRLVKPGELVMVNSADVEQLCADADPAAEHVE
jgi:hypothetical protein